MTLATLKTQDLNQPQRDYRVFNIRDGYADIEPFTVFNLFQTAPVERVSLDELDFITIGHYVTV